MTTRHGQLDPLDNSTLVTTRPKKKSTHVTTQPPVTTRPNLPYLFIYLFYVILLHFTLANKLQITNNFFLIHAPLFSIIISLPLVPPLFILFHFPLLISIPYSLPLPILVPLPLVHLLSSLFIILPYTCNN